MKLLHIKCLFLLCLFNSGFSNNNIKAQCLNDYLAQAELALDTLDFESAIRSYQAAIEFCSISRAKIQMLNQKINEAYNQINAVIEAERDTAKAAQGRAERNARIARENEVIANARSKELAREALISESLRLAFVAEQQSDVDSSLLTSYKAMRLMDSAKVTLASTLASFGLSVARKEGRLLSFPEPQRATEEGVATYVNNAIPQTLTISTDSVSLSNNKTSTKVWAISDEKPLQAYFRADGSFFLRMDSGKLKCYDREGKEVGSLAHNGHIYDVLLMTNGRIVTAGTDSTIKIWDEKFEIKDSIKRHDGIVYGLQSNVKKTHFVSFASDKKVILWDQNFNVVKVLEGFTADIKSAAFSPTEDKFLVNVGKELILYQLNGDMIARMQHEGFINFAHFAVDGKTILSGGEDKTVILWDIAGHELLRYKGFAYHLQDGQINLDANIVTAWSYKGELMECRIPEAVYKEMKEKDLSASRK